MVALALSLRIGIAAAASPAPMELGGTLLRSADLLVTDGHGTRRTPVTFTAPSACPAEQRCLRGAAEDRDFAVSVDLGPGRRALPLSVEARAKHDAAVRTVALRLSFTARGVELLGRDFRPARVARAILDRFDPKWIALRDGKTQVAAMIVDDDVDSVQVTAGSSGVTIDLELLAAAARPFAHLPRCGRNWRDVHGRVAVPDRYLHAADVLAAHGELLLGNALPVALAPWPEGRDAAFVITDHADQTSAPTLHALLAGSDDADLAHPSQGLLGHAIPITKALFQHGAMPHGGARPQLEDPAVVALADRARQIGVEIVPHSATPLSDDRRVTEDALAWFGSRGAHVWIDHQPQTNREGFCQSGWHTTSGIADLLVKHGYRDVWDLDEWAGAGLDERDPRHLDRRAPTVWPLGRLEKDGPEPLWMFRSTWAFVPTRTFFERYAESALDRLEKDRGLHIAHTYLETLHPPRTFFGRRNVLVRGRDGRVRLDPRLDALFASLEKRQARGTLWVTPLGVLGDRLRATTETRLRVTESGTIQLTRPATLERPTVHLAARAHLGGAAGQRDDDGATRAWLDACAPKDKPCTTELTLEAGSIFR